MKKNIFLGTIILFLVFGIFGGARLAKADCCAEDPTKVNSISSGLNLFGSLTSGSLPDVNCAEPSYDGSCSNLMKLIKNVSCTDLRDTAGVLGLGFTCKSIAPATSIPGCCVKTCSNIAMGKECRDGSDPVLGDCSAITSCSSAPGATSTPSSTPSSSATSITFPNPIGFTSVSDLLSSVLNNLMGLIAIVAVIFIIIGGIMYMASGGNEEMVKRAKKTWTGAVIGLAIALSAPTFLKEIRNILGGGGTGGSADNWVSNALTIKQIAVNVLGFLLSIFGILATIALIIGGGMYLTAYGDEKRIDSGKKILKYAIIGIVVSLAALLVVRQIGTLLGATMN